MKNEVKQRLEELYEEHGKLKASMIVDDAKDPDSPLHSEFNWDVDAAAYEFNLIQARNLIKRYNVTVKEPEEKFVHVPSVSVDPETGSKEGSYDKGKVVVRSQSEFELCYNQVVSQFNAAKRALDDLDRIAKREGDDSVVARLAVAMKALNTAEVSLKGIH